MKSFKYLVFTAIILLTVSSCRKGDDDPFFSLLSRKARLINEWILIEGTQTTTLIAGQNSITFDYTITEDSISHFDGYENQTFAYTERMTFKRDETFSLVTEQDYYGYGNMKVTYEGYWTFMNSVDDYEKKERVQLTIESMKTEFNGQSSTVMYDQEDISYILFITRLSNNELNFNFDFTIQNETTNIETSGTKKFVKE